MSICSTAALASEPEGEIVKAWIYENGQLTEISPDEYYELVNSITYTPVEAQARSINDTYSKASEYTTYLPARQVSAATKGPGYAFAATSVSVSAQFSVSVDYTIQVAIINAFTAQVAYSASSATGSISGTILEVGEGETGVVMFNPKVAIASGSITTSAGSTKWVETTAPVVLSNGLLDGIYFLKLV